MVSWLFAGRLLCTTGSAPEVSGMCRKIAGGQRQGGLSGRHRQLHQVQLGAPGICKLCSHRVLLGEFAAHSHRDQDGDW